MIFCGVVIPAYRAESSVAAVVAECFAVDAIAGVIVVDDGSDDATGACASAAGAAVLTHERNLGKGAALLTGFKRAGDLGWDAAIVVDADGQHDPASIPDFLRARAGTGADIVIGARARAGTAMPLARRTSNTLSSLVISMIAGVKVLDSQSGYRFVSRRVWESVTITTSRYDMESELLIRAAWKGFTVAHVPIETRYGDEQSHFRPWQDTMRIARLFWHLYLRDKDRPS